MSLKNKLNRLKPHLSIGAETENKAPITILPAFEVPFRTEWEKENVSPYFFDGDYCLVREVRYPLSERHGHYYFRDFLKAVEVWNKQPLGHPLSSEGHTPEELFFFDTETTGLGGGTGNIIFLLGYASIHGDELILKQHILPHPGAEVSLYQSFLENVNYKTLVTYNGKSFDWPQVKTRHTLVREHVPKLPAFGHFDLYHAAKRLWKHKLERMKLSMVEKEVLGVQRVDDIPGFLAPMIYFDFIERKQPEGMIGILKHNEIDILSLVTLYTHLTFQLHGLDQEQTRKESYEVGRWYSHLGEQQEAEKLFTKLSRGNDLTAYHAKMTLAYQTKKEKNWERTRSLFEEVLNSGDTGLILEACMELAKIHEHRIKDLNLATYYCEKAIKLTEEYPAKKKDIVSKEQLEARLKRLNSKSTKISNAEAKLEEFE